MLCLVKLRMKLHGVVLSQSGTTLPFTFTSSRLQVVGVCVVTPFSAAVGYQRFGATYCPQLQGEMEMEAEDLDLNLHRREILKSLSSSARPPPLR